MPSFFLANAALLNLNKWIYYTMRIFAFIRVGFGVKQGQNGEQCPSQSQSELAKESFMSSDSNDSGFSAQMDLYDK